MENRNKKPSPELFEMMRAAATNLSSFATLWESIKKKGHAEGFDDRALEQWFAPMVKDQMSQNQLRYLIHAESEKQRARDNRQKQKNQIKDAAYVRNNDDKKPLEQSSTNPHQTNVGKIREKKSSIGESESENVDWEAEYKKDMQKVQPLMIEMDERTGMISKKITVDDITDDLFYQAMQKRSDGMNKEYWMTQSVEHFRKHMEGMKGRGIKQLKNVYWEIS